MRADRSVRVSSRAEISIGAIARRVSQTSELVQAKFAVEIIFRQTGGIMSWRSIQPTGATIGIAAAITFGAGIIADSSMAPGSSLTSDSIHGGRTGIPMITTDTGITAIRTHTTRVITTRALTTMPTPIRTVMPINRPTQSLPRRRSVLPAKAIIVVKSTVSLALKRDVRLRAFKAATVFALVGI